MSKDEKDSVNARQEGLGAEVGTKESRCGWSACSNSAEARLEGRQLCRDHFYELAKRRVEEHRERMQKAAPEGKERIAVSQLLTDLISQATTLVATAKLLSPWQRDQFFELSLSAAELYKRVQRNLRVARNVPVLLHAEANSHRDPELTNTVDVSKRGACVETRRSWEVGTKLRLETLGNHRQALGKVAWVRKNGLSEFLMGIELLDGEDFWGLEPTPPEKKRSQPVAKPDGWRSS